MARRADIDLLFGLLALQNGLIEQGTLFAAFTTWAREKDLTMAGILQRQGSLDAQERALLEGLVEKHLERHGGDSEKSLASISSIESVRQELSQIDDPELCASLPPLSTTAKSDDDPFRTVPSYGVGASTSEGGRFRVLRPHAAGGLGQVFVARDTELNRDVAVKEIQERYADDPRHRRRFEIEAEITGGLEHPGIVPVYGLGCRADGRPYYAMRFIRGITLKEAIAQFRAGNSPGRELSQRGLELRKFLRRFMDVCNTVDYANQRGVVHRDLKPNNVMLGKHGETLVVDWGLAKAVGRPASDTPLDERTLAPELGSGSSETLPGAAIGTPAYMSPEQAAGELGRIGPASDVYSLGATLYTLLVGKPPFDDQDHGRMLQMVRAGQFRPPRKLDRSIDPALEAICLKAMAMAPVERYPSARALADDVERWMADMPVTARRDPTAVRLARWTRRHRTFAAAITVFLIVAAIASSTGAWLISLRRAEAERERGRAESNLALARQVVDEMYIRVSGQLEDVPGMDDYQRTILERARSFYEHEALPQNREPATRLAAAKTRLRLAYIDRKLGRIDEARDSARQALELYEGLVRFEPGRLEQRLGCAEARASLGRIEEQARNFRAASDQFQQAIDSKDEVARIFPTDSRYRLELGAAWGELGQALLQDHRLSEADSAYSCSLGLLEAIDAELPGLAVHRDALARVLDGAANLRTEENRDVESERLRRRALAMRRAALESTPSSQGARVQVAHGLNNLGYTLSRLKKSSEAEAKLRESIELWERIRAEHPDLPANRIELSRALSHLAKLLVDGGRSDEGLASYRRALQALRSGRPDRSDPPELLGRLAAQLYDVAVAEYNLARPDDADEHVRESIRNCETIVREQPGDHSILDTRGQGFLLLGLIARGLGRIDEALSSFRHAAESHEAVLRDAPGEPQVVGHLVAVLVEGLGKTCRMLGRTTDARASYRRAANLLAAIERKDATDLYNLACCLAQCSALGNHDDDAPADASLQDADRAVNALRCAIELRACDYATIQGDTDLDPLRDRADFKALVMDLAFPAEPFFGLKP
jgi:serine/threonine-protein kinase